MRNVRSFLCVVLVWCAVCDAARKVDIRIVPRPISEDEKSAGLIPFRSAAEPSGPYSHYVEHIGCIRESSVMVDEQPFLLDLCHLKNVTIVEDTTARDTIETEVISPPPMRQILGIFHGWHLDPITKKYKIAIFDDGDICVENPNYRYSIHVELVSTTVYDTQPRTFGFRKLAECTYAIKVELYVNDFELTPTNGIHATGVLDLSDPEETIENICGRRRCKYVMVEEKIENVKKEVQRVKEMMIPTTPTSVSNMTVSTASLILRSSTDVMEKALELLHSIEELYDSMQPQVPVETREVGVGTESDPPNALDAVVSVTSNSDSDEVVSMTES